MFTIFYNFIVNTNGFFHIFSYITSRCGFCLLLSFFITLILMPKYITFSKKWQLAGQPIRDNYLPEHTVKKGTPTCGGLLVLVITLFSSFIFANIKNGYVLILFFTLLSFGTIGFLDDYRKVKKKDTGGMRAKIKFLLQVLFSTIIVLISNYYVNSNYFSNVLTFPIFKNLTIELCFLYTLFRIFVIVGSSNAVNLTDGLDGLTTVPLILTSAVFIVFAYIIGNVSFSQYLLFHYQNGVYEICVVLSALIGSLMGFLWYNVKPAQIFMGDTGSLAFGGAIGVVAVLLKCEFLLAIVGGLFVIEALSVILQVGCFKITKGKKRIFKIAPLHHHFEKSGWSEVQVVVRFWIISIIFALLAVATLKIR